MKFLILDVYPSNDWRMVKDTAGGYGTGNDFGNSLFSKIINAYVSKMICMPPMYAIYVYSILKNKGLNVDYSRNYKEKKIFDDVDYVIMPSSIICHETEVRALKKITQEMGKKVFVIGIFSSVMKTKYEMKNSYIVPGEPESFFSKISYNQKDLDSFFNTTEKIEVPNNFLEDLDELPYPLWDEYVKKFPLKNNFVGFNSKVAIPLLATRGCPYSCFNYCTYPLQQGRKVRFRSVDNIVNEIEHWLEKLNTNKFIFRDPVFSINRKFTIDLCKEIIKRNLKIEFLIETHLKNLDDELIELLKQAGLKMVYVGIESSNEKVLDGIKRFTVSNDEQFTTISKLTKKDIVVKSMYMFGNPDDDEDTIKNTIEYSMQLPNQLVQYSVFTPYPGTPIFKLYENKISENNLERFNQYNLVYEHKHLDNKKILKLKNYGYKKFYFNYRRFFTVLKSFSSFLR